MLLSLIPAVLAGPVDDAWERLETLEAAGYPDIAAAEVLTALVEHPDDPDAPLGYFRLSAYQGRWGHLTGEIYSLERGALAHPELAAWFALARADVYLRREAWGPLVQAAAEAEPSSPAAAGLALWAHLGEGRPELALPLASDEALREAILAWDDLPRRRPALAAGLTVVVPGLGHAYAGRPGSGLASLLVEGSLATGVVFLARDGNLAASAALGAILVSSHIALVADASRQARAYNRRRAEERFAELKAAFAPRFELTDDPEAPLAESPRSP
jgi:hypothetical protein